MFRIIILIATLAMGALASTSQSVRAADSVRGLTMPIPLQVAMTEGIADLGNTKLWYWDTGGSGEVIVMLHPGSGSAEFYPYQQPVFAKAGYRVISYSRRGQYKSDVGTDADTYFAADDLLNLMKYLKVEKFHAVGSALGGYIALDIAMSNPERVHSLVLSGSMMGISEPAFKATLDSLRPKPFAELPMAVKELGPSYRAANPSGAAEWKMRQDRSGKRTPVRLHNKFTWETLAALKIRTLLVTGDADLWIPPVMLRRVGDKIPNSKVLIMREAGHSPHWEQPEAFNAAMLDFIGNNSAR